MHGEQIYFGLYAIKGLGENAVVKILDERERGGQFKSLANFCSRIDHKTCNRKGLESLIKSGAFDAFGERKQLLESLEDALSWAQGAASMLNSGMDALFGMEQTAPEPKPRQNVPPLGELEKLSLEKEALGLYISGHPLEQHEGLREAATVRIAALEDWFLSQPQKAGTNGRGPRVKAVLAGMIENVVKKPTKSGGMMARFNLADESATIELVGFCARLRAHSGQAGQRHPGAGHRGNRERGRRPAGGGRGSRDRRATLGRAQSDVRGH